MADNFIERIASGFGQTASVKNVFGEPIEVGDKKIIPVARIAYGFGGGYGEGGKKMAQPNQPSSEKQFPVGEGAGGGGGMYARAKGVFEIGPEGTRFIPAHAYQHLLMGIAIGVLLKAVLFRKRRK
ncbi:MAG: spore germination protein GerW family protein [Flavisolibacter sp.]